MWKDFLCCDLSDWYSIFQFFLNVTNLELLESFLQKKKQTPLFSSLGEDRDGVVSSLWSLLTSQLLFTRSEQQLFAFRQ